MKLRRVQSGARLGTLAAAIMALAAVVAPCRGQLASKELPEQVRGLDVIEQPGAQVPLDAVLTNSDGQQVTLGDYFGPGPDGRALPVILALVYYDCPVACPATLNAINQGINGLDYTLGEDFRVVVVSFDHTNTTEQAQENETYALTAYNRPKTPAIRDGIRFHTGSADEVRRIADAVGFEYRYLPEVDEYGHPSAIFILSPEGKVSRYMYGFQFYPGQMRLALLEASEGKIARSFGDKILLFCYSYDHTTGQYTLQAWRVMRVVGVLTVLALGSLVAALKVHELRRRTGARRAGPRAAPQTASGTSSQPSSEMSSPRLSPALGGGGGARSV